LDQGIGIHSSRQIFALTSIFLPKTTPTLGVAQLVIPHQRTALASPT
jgi:hypothetical protein